VDAFWLQLEGRRTVTLGPGVRPGTPEDLAPRREGQGRGWRTLHLEPGTLFHLPPWTPHDVVCHGRSLALSLTWRSLEVRRRPTEAARRGALVAWDVVSGRVDTQPPQSRSRLWVQVPVVPGPRTASGFDLVAPEGVLRLPRVSRPFGDWLALMPSFASPVTEHARRALAPLLALGIVAPQDLPLRIVPDEPRALDGWRFG
jgi:hypothetical protein